MIEKIELQGFKSFTQKTVLQFPNTHKDMKNITCVVGPNGSGKSNVVDAIRWVLGEQGGKTVRVKKSSDIIFSGSEKKSKLGMAEVSLHLDNSGKKLPIDYEQVIITRRLFRNGESEYLLNKNKVRLTDLITLLAQAQFGQKSYSIVSQGQIAHIVVASPAERKDFFDEAVGIKEYLLKRNTSLNKLERTEDNLEKVNLMLTEIEPRLKFLERQIKKLEQKEKLQEKLLALKGAFYFRKKDKFTQELSTTNQKETTVQKELDAYLTQLDAISSKINELEKQDSVIDQLESLQREHQLLQAQRNELTKEMALLRGRLDLQLESQGQIDLIWLNRKEEELKERISDTEKQLMPLQKQQELLDTDVRGYKEAVSDLMNKLNGYKSDLSQKQQIPHGNISADDILSQAEALLATLLEEHDALIQTLSNPDVLPGDIQSQVKKFRKALQSIQSLIKQKDQQQLPEDTSELTAMIEQTAIRLDETQRTMNNKVVELNVITEKNTILENQLTGLKKELLSIIEKRKKQESAADISRDDQMKAAEKALVEKNTLLEDVDKKQQKLSAQITEYQYAQEQQKKDFFALERKYQEQKRTADSLQSQKNRLDMDKVRLQTQLTTVAEEIDATEGLSDYIAKHGKTQSDAMHDTDEETLHHRILKTQRQLELIGGIDPETKEEYDETKTKFDFLHEQSTDMQKTINSLDKIISELDKTTSELFSTNFKKINDAFNDFFKMLFSGGNAKLSLFEREESQETKDSNEDDRQDTIPELQKTKKRSEKFKKQQFQGIDIYASPPGKKLSNIEMLSGGEKAMTALALIAAILKTNPSPFVVLDEVDAALDEANSQRMANIITKLAEETQFIIITHNRTIMHVADAIYGVTMGNDGVSKILSVKLEEIEKEGARL